MSTYPRQALRAAVAVVAATALGLVGVHAHRAAGATQPEAGSAAGPGTFVCTDRRGRLTLVRGDGRARRTIGLKGENPSFSPTPLYSAVYRRFANEALTGAPLEQSYSASSRWGRTRPTSINRCGFSG